MTDIFETLAWGISLFAILCWAIGAALTGLGVILRRSTAYWSRQIKRMSRGLEVEPAPWFVRLTTRMHGSRLLRRLLG